LVINIHVSLLQQSSQKSRDSSTWDPEMPLLRNLVSVDETLGSSGHTLYIFSCEDDGAFVTSAASAAVAVKFCMLSGWALSRCCPIRRQKRLSDIDRRKNKRRQLLAPASSEPTSLCRQADRRTDGQTDRQTHTHTHRHTYTRIHRQRQT